MQLRNLSCQTYRTLALGIAISVLLLLTATAGAEEVLDQEHDPTSSIGDTANQFSQSIGQTFTVGVAGTLSRIEVELGQIIDAGDNAVLTVYDTTPGGLPDTPLGSVSVSAAVVQSQVMFISFDVSSFAIPVAVNDLMAFGLNSDGGSLYLMPYAPDNPYPGGSGVWRGNGPPPGAWQFQGMGKDYGFRTYVEADLSELVGDYNGDGKVSAADFTVWRDSLGASTLTNRDPGNTGAVDGDDFQSWKDHYGEGDFGSGAGSSATGGLSASVPIPEPATIVMLLGSLFWATLQCLRHKHGTPFSPH